MWYVELLHYSDRENEADIGRRQSFYPFFIFHSLSLYIGFLLRGNLDTHSSQVLPLMASTMADRLVGVFSDPKLKKKNPKATRKELWLAIADQPTSSLWLSKESQLSQIPWGPHGWIRERQFSQEGQTLYLTEQHMSVHFDGLWSSLSPQSISNSGPSPLPLFACLEEQRPLITVKTLRE